MSEQEPRSVGERARYWLSDEGWAKAQEAERRREQEVKKISGPRPVHVEPYEPVASLVRKIADEVPRKDAVAFVRGWQLIFGDTKYERFDAYEDSDSIAQVAIELWFPTAQIMAVAFGPYYRDTLRTGQREAEIRNIREEVEAWLQTVEETLP